MNKHKNSLHKSLDGLDDKEFLQQIEKNCEEVAMHRVAESFRNLKNPEETIVGEMMLKNKLPFWEMVRLLKNFIGSRVAKDPWTREELEEFYNNYYPFINNRQFFPASKLIEGALVNAPLAGTGKGECLGGFDESLVVSTEDRILNELNSHDMVQHRLDQDIDDFALFVLNMIQEPFEQLPLLTLEGFRDKPTKKARKELKTSFKEVVEVMQFIARACPPEFKAGFKPIDSYSLKHIVEEATPTLDYVDNGVMILASKALGLEVRRADNSLNASIFIHPYTLRRIKSYKHKK